MTQLQKAYQVTDGALDERNELILQELPHVRYIATRIHERLPKHVELSDLISAGVLGLIEACLKYDPTQDASFSTFAKFRIRGAILDSLRSLDWGPRSLRRRGRAIAESTERLTQKLGRHPCLEELAEDLDVSLSELHETLQEVYSLSVANQQVIPRDAGEEPFDLIESAVGREDQNPFELCLQGEMRTQLVAALQTLSPREQMILSLYYQEELTMREVGEVLNIGVSRVSQLLSAALKKLRRELKSMGDTSQQIDYGDGL